MARLSSPLLLFAVLLACGCGLPSPYFLSPPGQSIQASPGNQVFTINRTTANVDQLGIQFLGFEMYYKFYADPSLIENNLSGNTNIDEYDLRNTYHFLPVCSQLDFFSLTPPADLHTNKPLLPVQSGNTSTIFITITFSNSPNTQPVVLYNGAPLPAPGLSEPLSIRRNVGDTTGFQSSTYQQPKPFIQPSLGQPYPYTIDGTPRGNPDPDVQLPWETVKTTGVAYLAIYAMSYGMQSFTPIFSSPVYLGYIQVNISP